MSAVGLVNMQLPAGSHTAELKYTISPIGRSARFVSCLAWAVWLSMAILVAIRWWKKDRGRALPLQEIGAS